MVFRLQKLDSNGQEIFKTNSEGEKVMARYSVADDEDYRSFMIDLLLCIEPRLIYKDEVIFEELD